MGAIPGLIVIDWAVGAEDGVLLALPVLATVDSAILIEGDGRNFVWFRLRTEVGVLGLNRLYIWLVALSRLDRACLRRGLIRPRLHLSLIGLGAGFLAS